MNKARRNPANIFASHAILLTYTLIALFPVFVILRATGLGGSRICPIFRATNIPDLRRLGSLHTTDLGGCRSTKRSAGFAGIS